MIAMTIDDVTVIAIIAGIMTVLIVSVYYHCAIFIIITTAVTMWTP